MRTAYNFALPDRFSPPEIHRMEWKEGRALVEATDNIFVSRVRISILDEENKVLEMGEAIRCEGDLWEFDSHTEGKTIKAQARDLANNANQFVLKQLRLCWENQR